MVIEIDSHNQVYVNGANVGGEGVTIRVLCGLYNLDGNTLAAEAGLSPSSLSRLMNGRRKFSKTTDTKLFTTLLSMASLDEDEEEY